MRRALLLLMATMMLTVVLAAGVALAANISCGAQNPLTPQCFGTPQSDLITGRNVRDIIYAKGSGDTLKGLGNDDYLFGQGSGDKLFGGSHADHLMGGPDNDTLDGQGGKDHYYFGPGWGKDSITEGVASLNNGVEFRRDAIEKPPVPVTEDLTINLNSGAGTEAKNASGTNTVDWDGSVISDVSGGAGDDTITGNLARNTIRGNAGEDNISGRKGDDEIDVRDGLGGDVVNCGEDGPSNADNDTVFFDAGDSVSNCETLNP